MKVLKFTNFSVDGIDTNDAPDFVDAYISSATAVLEDGSTRDASDSELEELNSDRQLVGDLVELHLINSY